MRRRSQCGGHNVYEPRVRELIRATGNPDLFPELNIPRSTISGWLRGDFKPAVGSEAVSQLHVRHITELRGKEAVS